MRGTESRRRSIVKALSWRVIAVVITASVTYVLTRRLELAAVVGLADSGVKLGAFYAHERVWGRIDFGLHRTDSATGERSQEK